MADCTQCPHAVGDSYQRDCDFPHCMGWSIERNKKPIPTNKHDWDFWHEDSEVFHTAESYQDAVNQIAEIIREQD